MKFFHVNKIFTLKNVIITAFSFPSKIYDVRPSFDQHQNLIFLSMKFYEKGGFSLKLSIGYVDNNSAFQTFTDNFHH